MMTRKGWGFASFNGVTLLWGMGCWLGPISSAGAEPPEESLTEAQLSFDTAPECPGAEYVEEKVAEWLAKPFAPQESLFAHAKSTFDGHFWHVSVEIRYGSTHGERQIKVETCTEAADFVAVSVALAMEPSRDFGKRS